jgi:hypothetical protein
MQVQQLSLKKRGGVKGSIEIFLQVVCVKTRQDIAPTFNISTLIKKSPLDSEENQFNERLAARKNQVKHNPF